MLFGMSTVTLARKRPLEESTQLGLRNMRPQPVVTESRELVVRVLRAVAVLGLCCYAAHSVLGLGGRSLNALFENWVFNALFFVGTALCLLRALWCSYERRAWIAMGLGLGCWAVGEVLFTLDPGQITAGSFPGTPDFLWLAFYPAAFTTLVLLVRARVRQFYYSLWLDGLLGALAVGALACQFLLPPIVAATGGPANAVVGDLIYPLGDLLLVAFVVAVLTLTGWRPGRVLGMVSVALALGAIADLASLYSSATGHDGSTLLDSLWPASAVVLGFAAWQPVRPSAVIVLQGRRLLVFPMIFALTALGLLALRQARPLHSAAYILAVLTIAGAIARMGLTFWENLKLVARSRREALTDPLTGLGNRRRLLLDLEDALQSASTSAPWALLLFDLNGFKQYNDSFGHPAGDTLLARLGTGLSQAAAPEGKAYRLGGDEFCVLAGLGKRSPETLSAAARAALSERGPGYDISTAHGCIMLPTDAQDTSTALRLVDQRLYAAKRSGRSSDTPDQLRGVLLQLVAERLPELPEHLHEVAAMAHSIGSRIGMAHEDLDTMVRAAELHDLGKVAVADAMLRKPDSLEPQERAIVERHCEVGERILAAAPAMSAVAQLVRASHERYDGSGYPDRLSGLDIPLGARIIAVCDAFHAMTADRPYHDGIDPGEAIADLRRKAGSQFDPEVVEAFCADFETRPRGLPGG
jgi:two-component system cell cycle response regulator